MLPCSMEWMLKPCSLTIEKLDRRTAVTLALPPLSRAKAAMVPMAPAPTKRTLAFLMATLGTDDVFAVVDCSLVATFGGKW